MIAVVCDYCLRIIEPVTGSDIDAAARFGRSIIHFCSDACRQAANDDYNEENS